MRHSSKAQIVLEYTLLLVAFMSAILAMFYFIRVRIQGRIKKNIDDMHQSRQYVPGETVTNENIVIDIP